MNWKTKPEPFMIHPSTGEMLYADTVIAPRWYWMWRRVCLFCKIVWRVWDTFPDGSKMRIGWRTAWVVAKIIHD